MMGSLPQGANGFCIYVTCIVIPNAEVYLTDHSIVGAVDLRLKFQVSMKESMIRDQSFLLCNLCAVYFRSHVRCNKNPTKNHAVQILVGLILKRFDSDLSSLLSVV